jgi:prepilin peptidase CpaA
MANQPFFPDPGFAWAFFGVIALLTAIAAWIDTRRAIIPKWLTIGMLAAGFVVNMTRAAVMGSQGKPLWVLDSGSIGLGILDGFLFSLAGFAFAFALLFGMWSLKLCGGGDVKLFAALGAWFGLPQVVYLFLLSLGALYLWVIGTMIHRGVNLKKIRKMNQVEPAKTKGKKVDRETQVKSPLRITYSFPIAVATVFLMLLLHRIDLNLPPWNL